MKRMVMLAVVAISLATASSAQACGGCGCGGFGWLGGGSCAPKKAVSQSDIAMSAYLTVRPLATGYVEFHQTKWTLLGMGLEQGLVGLTSR